MSQVITDLGMEFIVAGTCHRYLQVLQPVGLHRSQVTCGSGISQVSFTTYESGSSQVTLKPVALGLHRSVQKPVPQTLTGQLPKSQLMLFGKMKT